MEFLQLAENRFSVRSFSNQPVEREKLDKILRAGQVAPTACNKQPQKIFVLQSPEALAKWRKCTVCHFQETLVLLTCYDKNACWQRGYDGKTSGDIDASIVATHMMLEAASLGIGSTWVMYFIPEAARAEFALPDNLEPVCALAMGYPAPDAAPSAMHAQKKAPDETIVML